MMFGTKLLDTDMELFAASLLQQEVLIWVLNEQDVYEQVDQGIIAEYSPDYVLVRSSRPGSHIAEYRRDLCEFSIRFANGEPK
jgi:hypothetical protein